jgi:hypothetical protein
MTAAERANSGLAGYPGCVAELFVVMDLGIEHVLTLLMNLDMVMNSTEVAELVMQLFVVMA